MKPEKRTSLERGLFIGLIIGLTFYGLKNIDAAERLIRAVTDAFTLLLNTINP